MFYNFPFGKTPHYVLTSLMIVKLVLVYMDKFVTIGLNEFNDNDNSVLFQFRESEKGQKGNSNNPFSSYNPLSLKKYKIIRKG